MKKTVLVVDDDDSIRLLFARDLERLGYEVVTAEDGAEVPDLIAARRFHLLVIDLYMPGMNGIEVLRQLRRRPSGLLPAPRTPATVPVLVVSGEAHPASIRCSKAAGATEYLTKPVDIDVFEESVCRLLDQEWRGRARG